MDVVCNVIDCAYHSSNFCTCKYVFIVNGTCRWLINNPNYRSKPNNENNSSNNIVEE